jgi:membrane protease YdiL (CAAX protease family)
MTARPLPEPTSHDEEARAGLAPLAVFIAVAYGLSWAWMIPVGLTGGVIERGDGWPTHVPALLGPMLAALAVTAWRGGRRGLRDLLAAMGDWRMPLRWWAVACSPLVFLAIGLAVAALTGTAPRAGGFGRASGYPAIGLIAVVLASTVINGFGEETGWRGFAQPLLQRRFRPLTAALLVTPIWAGWHIPFFFTVGTYRDFAPGGYVAFVFGLACGSIVLAWLYNGSGGSIAACAVWHGTFNVATGTAASTGVIPAVVSTLVIVNALILVVVDVRHQRRRIASTSSRRRADAWEPGRDA